MLQDLRYSLRLLRKTPGFTAVAVGVLALGIGVNTAVFSMVNALVLQPRPGRIDQMVAVFSRDRNKPDHFRDFSYPAYLDMRERGDIFDSMLAHTFSTVGITEGEVTKQTFASIVSANYFSTLGVQLAAGRTFTADEERPGANAHVAIASYSVWRRAGFDPAFVGRVVRVSGSDYTVVGVAPRGFSGPNGWAMTYAAHGGHEAAVDKLVEWRADLTMRDGNGCSASTAAWLAGHKALDSKLFVLELKAEGRWQ